MGVDPVAAVTAVLGAAQKTYELAKKSQNLELQESIADLRERVLSLREECLKLQEDNLKLRTELKEAKQQHSAVSVGELIFRDKAYYLAEPVANQPNGPFCPNCWTARQRRILMNDLGVAFAAVGARYECPECKTTFA